MPLSGLLRLLLASPAKVLIYRNEANGTWVGAISLGWRPDGKRIWRKVTGRTKAEVPDKLKKLQAETDDAVAAPAPGEIHISPRGLPGAGYCRRIGMKRLTFAVLGSRVIVWASLMLTCGLVSPAWRNACSSRAASAAVPR